MSDSELSNVHEAIQRAQMSTRLSNLTERIGVRLEKSSKDRATLICHSHGISLSDFFRECADGLIRDYYSPKLKGGK